MADDSGASGASSQASNTTAGSASPAGGAGGSGAGAAAVASTGAEPQAPPVQLTEGSQKGRLAFQYKGRTVYEWEQTLEEIHMYIVPPPGVKAKMLDVKITSTHVRIGIKGNPPFISVRHYPRRGVGTVVRGLSHLRTRM